MTMMQARDDETWVQRHLDIREVAPSKQGKKVPLGCSLLFEPLSSCYYRLFLTHLRWILDHSIQAHIKSHFLFVCAGARASE